MVIIHSLTGWVWVSCFCILAAGWNNADRGSRGGTGPERARVGSRRHAGQVCRGDWTRARCIMCSYLIWMYWLAGRWMHELVNESTSQWMDGRPDNGWMDRWIVGCDWFLEPVGWWVEPLVLFWITDRVKGWLTDGMNILRPAKRPTNSPTSLPLTHLLTELSHTHTPLTHPLSYSANTRLLINCSIDESEGRCVNRLIG